MREFQKRRTRGSEILRISLGVGGVLLLCAVAYFLARGAWDMYGKFASAAAARATAEAQVVELEGRRASIESEVEALSTERGIETAVRERYGVARPGEGEIAIVRQSSSTEILRQEPGVFERLWQMLFVW
jgi:cell division protein FtsB